MGSDIKQLRTRIRSVDSTLHLTRAMGLVASSKIRRATDAMQKGREYAAALRATVELLCAAKECQRSPYAAHRADGRTTLLVIAGDRGLAGGYNANIFRLLREYPDARVIPIGKRACDRFGAPTVYAEGYSYGDAIKTARTLCAEFAEGETDRVGVLCTRYESMMSQRAEIEWLLPLTGLGGESHDAIFEPDELTVLDAVVPDYVAGMLLSCVKESFACEVAARRVAMDSAGKNAEAMITELMLDYNRARQGAITQEITEIVAGSGV
ncbi:MAG: ATP synthase F1 subunit gamma [Clostridia bacterium]|nr:ATP synthase F1 subunit gamma [Clostridia bacterium]